MLFLTQRERLLLLFLCCQLIHGDSLCLVCEGGVSGIRWPHAVLKPDGTTCVDIALELATNFLPGSYECEAEIAKYREPCCGDEEPADVEFVETLPPAYNGPMGDYPVCDICRDGDYPGVTSMVISVLYMGSGSCKQFWEYGQRGLIKTYMCDAIQYFAYEPCGCGEFNPNFGMNQAPEHEETPLPNPAPIPSPAPVPKPSPTPPPPTPVPTPSPAPPVTEAVRPRIRKNPNVDSKHTLKIGGNRGGHGGMRRLLKGRL